MPSNDEATKTPAAPSPTSSQAVVALTRRTGATMTKSKKAAKPLTRQELQYCEHYCIHGNQTQAYRQTWPDTARPADAASKLMKRADVQEHIATMLEKMQEESAERSAEALILTLEKAESRLAELIEQRRHNRGEMLTQMTGKVYDKGITFETVTGPQGGTKIVPVYSQEFTDSLEQPKPIEDADLVKAIDITFKRLGAYPGKTEAPAAPVQNNYLYRPQWLQVAR